MWNQTEQFKLYDAIFHRKSVRRFKRELLSAEVVSDTEEQLKKLVPLFPECQVSFRILNQKQVQGRVTSDAYHIAVYTECSIKNYTNAGFMLQQMDLWLSAKGLGSWWHGLISPSAPQKEADGLPFAFILTFGIAAENVHRLNAAEFQRKELGQIANVTGMDKLLEAVRLAPSSMNGQPWYFTGCESSLRLYKAKAGGNPILKKMLKNIQYLDGGIALCHLWLAASVEGFMISFEQENAVPTLSESYEYICTANLRKH